MIRVKRVDQPEHFVGRRYGDFSRMYKRLQTELPGKVLPNLPRKNQSSTSASMFSGIYGGGADDDDASSVSSQSTTDAPSDSHRSLGQTLGLKGTASFCTCSA